MTNYARHHDYFVRAERYIERDAEARLTVKEIAFALGVNPSDLIRIFKEEKRLTLKNYLDQQLKNRVLQFLKSERIGQQKLSYQLGFSSEQSFYRWVRRVFGVPFKQVSKIARQDGTRRAILSSYLGPS